MSSFSATCPIPLTDYKQITLAHGGGGRLTHDLISKLVYTALGNPLLEEGHDGAFLPALNGPLAFTTDSYVVSPLFFPGGDIGSLAIYGTVNDLAMCGAEPCYLSLSLIIEEGLEVEVLWQVLQSLAHSAKEAKVQIVTGDTKVVERGKADKIFINTSGIGVISSPLKISPAAIRPGDQILLSGDIGRHGITILSAREGLKFETELKSDCAPLARVVKCLLDSDIEVHCLRDLTRGGLATATIELSEQCRLRFQLREAAIGIAPQVQGACEILGLDPLYVANEGRFISFVPENQAKQALEIMQSFNEDASIIGKVSENARSGVVMENLLGTNRPLEMFSGEQLPRIC